MLSRYSCQALKGGSEITQKPKTKNQKPKTKKSGTITPEEENN